MKPRPNYGSYRSESMRSGYVRIWQPGHPLAMQDGYVFEHRLMVWESGLDPRGWQVHHRNGNVQDNRLENLELRRNGEHQRYHYSLPGATVTNQHGKWEVARNGLKRCPSCGEEKSVENFWINPRTNRPFSYCRPCCVIKTSQIRQRKKERASG